MNTLSERTEILESHVRQDGLRLIVPVIMDDAAMATNGPWVKNAAVRYATQHPVMRGLDPGWLSSGPPRPLVAYLSNGPVPRRDRITVDELHKMAVTDHMAKQAADAQAADHRIVVEVTVG